MSKISVLSKGQITIPKDVREALQVGPGDTIFFQSNIHREVRISKEPRETLDIKATLTEKGQVTIPKYIRDHLQLKTTDVLIFHSLNETIFFRKHGGMIPCPGCAGTGAYKPFNLPCFVCDQTGNIEQHEEGLLFLLFFQNKFRKYKVGVTIIQQELNENGIFQCTQIPKLLLRSEVYPNDILRTIQDRLQFVLAKERISQNFVSTVKQEELLGLFEVEEIKDEIRTWFRKG